MGPDQDQPSSGQPTLREVCTSQEQKHDGSKIPMDLLPTIGLVKVAEVLQFGAHKYSSHQWRGGMDWSLLIGASFRHLTAYNDGEDLDPESGLSHIAHLACNALFLLEYEDTHPELDNRYTPEIADVDAYCAIPVDILSRLARPGETYGDTYTRVFEQEIITNGSAETSHRFDGAGTCRCNSIGEICPTHGKH